MKHRKVKQENIKKTKIVVGIYILIFLSIGLLGETIWRAGTLPYDMGLSSAMVLVFQQIVSGEVLPLFTLAMIGIALGIIFLTIKFENKPMLTGTQNVLLNDKEVLSLEERQVLNADISIPHAKHYLKGLEHITGDAGAEIVFVACGAVSHQAKEAHRKLAKQGIKSKVVKLRTIRPFPHTELLEATKGAKYIFVPEFNAVGWLDKEVTTSLYGKSTAKIIGRPRVASGMSMPVKAILKEVFKNVNKKKGA